MCIWGAHPGDNFHNKMSKIQLVFFGGGGGGGGDGLITVDPSLSNISISINP